MLFVEFAFLPFFLAVFLVHWLLPRHRARKLWLLVASYFFYGFWDWRFLSLILASTLVDYVVGIKLESSSHRKRWLGLSLCANLGLLGTFKYLGFFVDSAARLLESLGFQAHLPTLEILLPVGISFYTFQTLSYSIDVYRGQMRPTRDVLDLALFVAFFPQLVAGPIVRAVDFLPQLAEKRTLARVDVRAALVLFLVGFFKKACVSDNLSLLVDTYFESPAAFDELSAWIAVLAYAVQIYADFSGYSDMAIACAALLGYELCLNFDHPYFSGSITAFWRRWHISLSSWLRDYLYVPLGGNRGGRFRTHMNLLLTMLLGGLWHGAGWNFVFWGGLHGLGLIGHRLWTAKLVEEHPLRRLVSWIGIPLTFYFVCVGWVFFRATSTDAAFDTLRGFLLFSSEGQRALPGGFGPVFVLLLVLHVCSRSIPFERAWRSVPAPVFALSYGLLVSFVLPFVAAGAEPFIYFQF